MQEDPKRDDLCPGRPRAKRMPRVTLRPASRKDPVEGVPDRPAPVILKPAVQKGQAEKAPEASQLIEDSPPEVPHSVEGEQEVPGPGPVEREGDGPGQVEYALEVLGLVECEHEVLPAKPKRYRRVRVRKVMKKDPNLAEDREIQQLQARQASRAERLANLRKMQKERQEKMQPRTPSPSTLDTEAAQRETERQREEAVVCGRRVLTYEEWEKRREREKGERGPGEEKKGLNRKRNSTSAASGTAG